jgi:hypothetical protein
MLNNIQITVTDSSLPTPQTVTATLALRVTSTLTINSSAVLPTARLDQAISPVVLRAVSGVSPYQWSLTGGSLPPGLSLDAATGQLTRTPTAAGDYVLTIMVTDSKQPAQTFSKEFIYHVSRTLTIDTNALPDGGKEVFYSYTLPVSGGRQPYAWRVKTGTLPAGLTIDAATGTIARETDLRGFRPGHHSGYRWRHAGPDRRKVLCHQYLGQTVHHHDQPAERPLGAGIYGKC